MTAAPPFGSPAPSSAASTSPASPPAVPVKGAPPAVAAKAAAPRRAAVPDLLDERTAIAKMGRLRKLTTIQSYIIAGLTLVLLVALTLLQPVYLNYAREPDNKVLKMAGLTMPNMTNRAVLSWAVTAITEIMTMGFGDMDLRLPQQRIRFTPEGWEAYTKAFVAQNIGKAFKQNQLVLTTVPSNTPVIVYQGVNAEGVYQWVVQMPVIMTYATNNNVTRKQKSIVTLVIVRVAGSQSSSGIAIKSWMLN